MTAGKDKKQDQNKIEDSASKVVIENPRLLFTKAQHDLANDLADIVSAAMPGHETAYVIRIVHNIERMIAAGIEIRLSDIARYKAEAFEERLVKDVEEAFKDRLMKDIEAMLDTKIKDALNQKRGNDGQN